VLYESGSRCLGNIFAGLAVVSRKNDFGTFAYHAVNRCSTDTVSTAGNKDDFVLESICDG